MRFVHGIYDQLCSTDLAKELMETDDGVRRELDPLDPADTSLRLTQYLLPVLQSAFESCTGENKQVAQLKFLESILEQCKLVLGTEQLPSLLLGNDPKVLRSVSSKLRSKPIHPDIPVSMTDLLVNGSHDKSLGAQLTKEILSADRIDVLCSFLKWSGFRILQPSLQQFLADGKKIRVLTTTYMGATESRVIEEFISMGADVKISYDATKTRLHAKTWYLHRNSGFSTCYLGSSNLSHAALLDGVEWNVRLSMVDNPSVVQKVAMTFEQYWQSTEFNTYDAERFKHHSGSQQPRTILPNIEIKPRGYQIEMLESLSLERQLGYRKNLLVAATGTGKTMVAALDCKRLLENKQVKTLLFVAHRREILEQAMATFRLVLRHNTFGEGLWNNQTPNNWSVVFASIQSLKNTKHHLPNDHFDMVIIDESHHASAGTYTAVLEYFTPQYLLGLTATPERMDGQSILPFFDNRIAYELRLWDALEQEILCPFQYFMTSVENLDLRGVTWQNGGYNIQELQNVYTGNDILVQQILRELERVVLDCTQMKALAFCVNIAHAEYMASKFQEFGVKAVAITSQSGNRDEALLQLRQGNIQCICCVDIFNEGVDVPNIDTILFLRPTQSQTIFLQQLGRGLRRSSNKPCLTVLDFVGQVHEKFQFANMFKGLIGGSTTSIREAITHDFPQLPSGCSIVLDRIAKETVLSRLQITKGIRGFIAELKSIGDCSLWNFLQSIDLAIEDFYCNASYSFTEIRSRCGFIPSIEATAYQKHFQRALYRSVYLNNREMLEIMVHFLEQDTPNISLESASMRWIGVVLGLADLPLLEWDTAIKDLWAYPGLREEWSSVAQILLERSKIQSSFVIGQEKLFVNACYSSQDVMAIFNLRENSGKIKNIREGVYYNKDAHTDIFFVTLQKTSNHFSTSTMYKDYPVSSELFHWQSQNGTNERTAVGKRYTSILDGSIHRAVLFVRESNTDTQGRTQAFRCLGPCTYVSHEGGNPMSILWKMQYPITFSVFQKMKVTAG